MVSSRSSKSAPRRPKAARSPPSKSSKKTAAKKARRPAPKPTPKPTPKKTAPPAKTSGSKKATTAPVPAPVLPEPRRSDGRRHLLSLSFVRDGDEFLARLETDTGHITELKNRALDQLLTLVAGELEDLLD
ncbi:MAG: hypothetical protein WB789_07660 [Thermoplasmata archaeon]